MKCGIANVFQSNGFSQWRHRFYLVLWAATLFLSVDVAFSVPTPFPEEIRRYDFEGPQPRRIALVVGNSEYVSANKLPGSLTDAAEMTKLLKRLQFEVEEPKQFSTRADFFKNQATPFRNKIQNGDFVIFYFSGHGFTFGGENFITPLEFPLIIKDDEEIESLILKTFITESGLRDYFLNKSPEFLMLIFDACRTIGRPPSLSNPIQNDDITKDAGVLEFTDQKPIIKFNSGRQMELVNGLSEPSLKPANVTTVFASKAGQPAIGKSDGSLSYFTSALTELLDTPDDEFSSLERQLTIRLHDKTGYRQTPGFYEERENYVWFNPTSNKTNEIREAWYYSLKDSTNSAIESFRRLYSLSPYAKAADQWLSDRQQGAPTNASISRYASESSEAGWNQSESEPGKRILMAGSIGPLAMTRSARSYVRTPVEMEMAQKAFDASVSLTGQEPPKQSAQLTAELLAAHGDAVSLSPNLDIYATPSLGAPIVAQANYMQQLQVDDIATSADGNTWTKVSLKNVDQGGYVRIPQPQQSRIADIGVPIEEIYFSTTEEDTYPFIKAENLRETLSRLTKAGNKIKWVSIATANTTRHRLHDILRARASHAFVIATEFGISRSQISIVEGADFGGSQIRLRFFGN